MLASISTLYYVGINVTHLTSCCQVRKQHPSKGTLLVTVMFV